MKKVPVAIAVVAIVCACGMTGCDSEVESYDIGEEPCFGIYLVDSGELVLSEQHIKAYRRGMHFYVDDTETHVIELNEEGIEKWNSFMTYESIPKLNETLYKRDFVLKIEGEEIYRGKFHSMMSSMSYDGVVIMDALIKLDNDLNYIRIDYGYPSLGFATGEDPRNSPEVIDFLDAMGLLE
jgi:tmRNA-binding protein